VKPVGRAVADSSAVEEYKRILQQVLENRPAGTRGRLADALGKNRSFISQITNPNYSVPIPAPHIETIFEICHFLTAEKSRFLATYARAHPNRAPANRAEPRWRELVLRVPDLRDREKNKLLDELLKDTLQKVVRLIE
jgi:transcriptional regulator with XRE-family HTH domain